MAVLIEIQEECLGLLLQQKSATFGRGSNSICTQLRQEHVVTLDKIFGPQLWRRESLRSSMRS